MQAPIPEVTVARLLSDYEVLLLDAYGALVDGHGALAGAPELIQHLNEIRHPYFVLTNDASRLPSSSAKRFHSLDMAISPERIITSGSLLPRYFAQHGLTGASCAVLGPPDSAQYVIDAGAEVVDWNDPAVARVDALVVGDEVGFEFMPRMNQALSILFARMDAGTPVRLILPNPDLVYPSGPGEFAFAAGSLAMWFEAALALRYPEKALQTFDRLGKPYAAIFDSVLERTQTRNMVMVGDQLETDIHGARAFGLDAALVTFGITRESLNDVPAAMRPNFIVRSWAL